ncbi:MAG: DUF3592 domain-containing protein [Pseudomonadota bacterium]
MPEEYAWLSLVFRVIPWLIVAAGIWLLWAAHNFTTRAHRVRGRVIELNEERIRPRRPSGKTIVLHRPVFQYIGPDGQRYEAGIFSPATGLKLEMGEEYDILLDPDLPEIARLAGSAPYAPGLMLVAAGFFAVLIAQYLTG